MTPRGSMKAAFSNVAAPRQEGAMGPVGWLRFVVHRWRMWRRPTLDALMLGTPAKIQIGSGNTGLDGWVNTDLHHQILLDLLSPWPIPTGSVDYVYGDNVIEHFTLEDARVVLRHAAAAIRPGGTLRLATPDVGRVSRVYLEGGDDLQAMLDRHRRSGYTIEHGVDALRVIFCESEHHLGYLFDEPSLTHELEQAGFMNVRRCRVGISDDPVLRGLESRATPEDELWSLVLEADRRHSSYPRSQ